MTPVTLPLIVRGEVIESSLREHGRFQAPDASQYLDQLVLREPRGLSDLYALSLPEVVDYLVALGDELDTNRNPHLTWALEHSDGGGIYSPQMLRAIYDQMPTVLQRDAIEQYIEQNIGAAYLDGWVTTHLRDRTMEVRAFGARAVHVIAGNSPLIALQTALSNAVSRSDAIVKLPANDPFPMIAIARTMIDMAPDHPLTRHLSVVYWKGGDETVERRLYTPRNLEKVVAWGGMASMRSIRGYLVPGLDLVALDPKLSASIIGREAFTSEKAMEDAARRAAADIGYVNQGGCACARVLYAESGTDPAGIANANRFGALLFDAIQALPPTLSSPHPAFDPVLREELDGLRFSSDFKIVGGRSSEGAVIVSQREEVVDFSDRLDCRVANIVPIDSVEDALSYLTIDTQTIGIYPDALKQRLRDECAMRGGQRIVSLGYATAAEMTGPWDAIQPLARMVRWLRDDTINTDVFAEADESRDVAQPA
jgi:Acyl-CoA reductase (LuxC)